MIELSQAITSLRPDTEWVLYGQSIDGVVWITTDVEPLSEAQVAKEIKRLEALAVTTEANRVATIQAARDHAASLGFNDAMLAVMYPNLAP